MCFFKIYIENVSYVSEDMSLRFLGNVALCFLYIVVFLIKKACIAENPRGPLLEIDVQTSFQKPVLSFGDRKF